MTIDHRRKKTLPHRLNKQVKKTPPAYEPDDGSLTAKQIEAIKKLEPQGRCKWSSSLF